LIGEGRALILRGSVLAILRRAADGYDQEPISRFAEPAHCHFETIFWQFKRCTPHGVIVDNRRLNKNLIAVYADTIRTRGHKPIFSFAPLLS
jgi:hypothetical protein